ncbi:MAG: type III-B CRISPR module RAMP protein Cmr1 [Candidatus Lokiarchaeota archaeon]|nr:type III-B CRISPR module RAMP protein Cmr1 [Candidatus Lokiarchaeota archaeon]
MRINILTPLFTGNMDGQTDIIRSTGVSGSIRWWNEAIFRGFNYFACDPNSNSSCPQDSNYYCHNCMLFGSTDIRRSFKLIIENEELSDSYRNRRILNIKPRERNRGWYLDKGKIGNFDLNLIPLTLNIDLSPVNLAIKIASKWGAIGAKTQIGYGVVEIADNKDPITIKNLKENFEKMINDRLNLINIKLRRFYDKKLPNLKEFFFSKIQFKVSNVRNESWWENINIVKTENEKQLREWYYNSNSFPIAPSIKNWLRFKNGQNLIKNNNNTVKNFLYGKSKESASKINISSAYQVKENLWEFRIWGWIPQKKDFDREEFLNNLKSCLNGSNEDIKIPWDEILGSKISNVNLIIWREFNSERDSVNNLSRIEDFIESLL